MAQLIKHKTEKKEKIIKEEEKGNYFKYSLIKGYITKLKKKLHYNT